MKKLFALLISTVLMFSVLPSASANWWDDLVGDLSDGAKELWGDVKDEAGDIWGSVKNEASGIWSSIESEAGALWDEASSGVKELWEEYSGDVGALFSALYGFALDKWDKAKVFGTDAWKQFRKNAAPVYEKIVTEADNVWKSISNTAGDTWCWLKTEASSAAKEAKEDYLEVLSWLKENTPEGLSGKLNDILLDYGLSTEEIGNIIRYVAGYAAQMGINENSLLSAVAPVIICLANKVAGAGADLADLPMDELIIGLINPWLESLDLNDKVSVKDLLEGLKQTLETVFPG